MWELIRANKIKSYVLMALMLVILLTLGAAIAGAVHPQSFYLGIAVAALIWLGLSTTAFFQGDRIMLSMSGAKEVTHQEAPRLYNVVEEMKLASGLPVIPKVYVIEDEALNAFATGRNPERSAVAITSGLLKRLSRDELQGVIAHEMSHVVNRDILFMTLAGIMVGSVVMISDGFLRGMFYGRRTRSRRSSSSSGGGQAQLVFLVAALVLAVLGPIMARLLYLAISRRREYLADASAVRLTRYPPGLADALGKLGADRGKLDRANRAMAPMYISNPYKSKKKMRAWGSTHPPIQSRIAVLRAMGTGADLQAYEQAWKQVAGQKSGLIPKGSLGEDQRAQARCARPDDRPHSQREVGDMLRAASGQAFIHCSCGVKIKVPQRLQQDELFCPRCGARHQVSSARPAGSPEAPSSKRKTAADLAGAGVPLPIPGAPALLPAGRWGNVACPCGQVIPISPAFGGKKVRCRACGAETTVRRG